uniref:SFRICE_019626 n=1 Tax=Spodoptera frugiperda TaxID=7108 RepID=A0A2H1W1Y5_SPOFR
MESGSEAEHFGGKKMTPIFAKNGVLSGWLEHYCLVCDELFKTEEETLVHIFSSLHKSKLNKCGYLEKYKGHFIRKVNGIYFCEPCSLTFPVATKVDLHINELTHLDARSASIATPRRIDANTLAYDRFIISDDAWNGCLKDSCVLCSIEFEESDPQAHKSAHKISRDHVLNLLRSVVIRRSPLSEEQNIALYRKIDAKTNHCLTCNEIIRLDIRSHVEDVKHKKAVKLSEENKGVQVKADTSLNNGDASKSFHNINNDRGDKGINKIHLGGTVNGDTKKHVDKVKDGIKAPGAADENDTYFKNIDIRNYITDYKGKKWCVLCDCVLTNCQPEEHLRSEHHNTLMRLHKGKIEYVQQANRSANSNMDDNVDRYQENNINMNLINETAFCKKCSKNIDFDTDSIDKHIEEHKTAMKKPKINVPFLSGMKSSGSERTTLFTNPVLLTSAETKTDKPEPKVTKLQEFAKTHGFTRNSADNSYYCHACDRRLANDMVKLHVKNKTHIENITKTTSRTYEKTVTKQPLLEVVTVGELFDNNVEKELILIINDKYWLNAFGFFLLAEFRRKVFCQACNIDIPVENIVEHIIKDEHRDAVENCLVVTSMEDEFIREIKLNKYHCGYCNIVEEDWDDMVDHVNLPEHKSEKLKAEEKLRRYAKLHRIREVITMEQDENDQLMKAFLRKMNGLSRH